MLTSGGTGQAPGTAGRHRGGGAVIACVAVAAVLLVVLHVDGVGVVDPMVQTISDHVAVPGGYALLGVAALALAAAAGLLAGRLRPAGLVDPGPPAGFLAAAAPTLTWLCGIVGGLGAAFLLSHVPIVITGSPIFTAEGALQRVLYAVVMVVLLLIARATRSAIDAARTEADRPPGAAEVRGIA